MQRVKAFWSVSNDLIHKGESLYCCAFNNINHNTAHYPLKFFHICKSVYNSASDGSTQRVTYHYYILLRKAL